MQMKEMWVSNLNLFTSRSNIEFPLSFTSSLKLHFPQRLIMTTFCSALPCRSKIKQRVFCEMFGGKYLPTRLMQNLLLKGYVPHKFITLPNFDIFWRFVFSEQFFSQFSSEYALIGKYQQVKRKKRKLCIRKK